MPRAKCRLITSGMNGWMIMLLREAHMARSGMLAADVRTKAALDAVTGCVHVMANAN